MPNFPTHDSDRHLPRYRSTPSSMRETTLTPLDREVRQLLDENKADIRISVFGTEILVVIKLNELT
jgi:hypothetical protein